MPLLLDAFIAAHAVTIDDAVTIDLLLRVRSSDSNLFTFQRCTPRIWGTFRACYFYVLYFKIRYIMQDDPAGKEKIVGLNCHARIGQRVQLTQQGRCIL